MCVCVWEGDSNPRSPREVHFFIFGGGRQMSILSSLARSHFVHHNLFSASRLIISLAQLLATYWIPPCFTTQISQSSVLCRFLLFSKWCLYVPRPCKIRSLKRFQVSSASYSAIGSAVAVLAGDVLSFGDTLHGTWCQMLKVPFILWQILISYVCVATTGRRDHRCWTLVDHTSRF